MESSVHKQILRFFFLFILIVFIIGIAFHLDKFPTQTKNENQLYQHVEHRTFH